jgi:hypothetical protein
MMFVCEGIQIVMLPKSSDICSVLKSGHDHCGHFYAPEIKDQLPYIVLLFFVLSIILSSTKNFDLGYNF